ncbi:MAG: DUF4105 domain-containing protein, partial [Gemmatimonadota bacterium]|nr:DUF4105 domain-containing protein [Gemmatimonadota bacterium]
MTLTSASPGRVSRLLRRGALLAAAPCLAAGPLAAQSAGSAPPATAQQRAQGAGGARATVRAATPTQAPVPVGTIRGRITAGPDSLIVSLLTIGPGEQLFDRFGHSSIRVRNDAIGLDSAWNWGMYDFESAGFIWRFLTGDTRYWMAGFPSPLLVDFYHRAHRAVWEQELNLSRPEADSLLAFLRWNAQPEHRFYRYDYYLDNCSTRVRDAIDAVTGGALQRTMRGATKGVTWRGETLRLAEAFPTIAFGMTFALGPRADAILTQWEEAFVPMRLRDALRDVRVSGPGGPEPLVRAERVLAPEGPWAEASAPPRYAAPAAVIGLAVGVLLLLLRRAGPPVASRAVIGACGSVWHLVVGIAGTLVLLAGLFTRHQFMAANASVLLGTPASLALAVLYVRAWSPRASGRTRRAGVALCVVAAVCAAVALLVHAAPAWSPEDLFRLFPNLARMPGRSGGAMSGGEQQMLTVARTL